MTEPVDGLCNKPAVYKVYWPGRDPLPMCADHYAWLVKVANAIGLYVRAEQAEHALLCTQHVSD